MKLALLGSTNVGKTTLGHYLSVQSQPLEYIPTIGVDIMYIYLDLQKKVTIYDLAGEERFKKICDSFVISADLLAFCYNCNDYSSFIYAVKRYNECSRLGYTFQKKIIFIATQADKPVFANYEEIVKYQLGDSLLFTTSSKNKSGREEVLNYLESIYPKELPLEFEEEMEEYYEYKSCMDKCRLM